MFCKNIFSRKAETPFQYKGDFATYSLLPGNSDTFSTISDKLKEEKPLAIVLQGPIRHDSNFTLETVRIYRKNFPHCQVIISTWENEREDVLALLEKENAIVLRNQLPDIRGLGNTNYQIHSSYEGIKKAQELGFEYVIKSRTDQRFYEVNIPEYLHNLLELFPKDPTLENFQKKRLIALSFNTFRYRLYDISDMFLFGHIDDVLNFWSCEQITNNDIGAFNNLKEYAQQRPCEIYFTTEYVKKSGRALRWSLRDSWEVYAKYFCVIDASSLGFYWPKYSNLVQRWRNFFGHHPSLEELTFKEWINLYQGIENRQYINDYFIENQPAPLKKTILTIGKNLYAELSQKCDLSAHTFHEIASIDDQEAFNASIQSRDFSLLIITADSTSKRLSSDNQQAVLHQFLIDNASQLENEIVIINDVASSAGASAGELQKLKEKLPKLIYLSKNTGTSSPTHSNTSLASELISLRIFSPLKKRLQRKIFWHHIKFGR